MKKLSIILISIFSILLFQQCEDDPITPIDDDANTEEYVPSNPSPATGSFDQNLYVTLQWESVNANEYFINFGTTNPPPLYDELVSTIDDGAHQFVITGLSYATTYYWQIGANSVDDSTYLSEVWSFTTKAYQAEPGYKLTKHYIEVESPSYVNIMFQATDMDGRGIDNLTTTNFQVLEDNQPVSPTESAMQIKKKDLIPYTLETVLLLDNSLSVGSNLSEIKKAAIELVNNMVSKQEVAIYKFSEKPVLIQNFTSNKSDLITAINSIELGFATTDLYGSMIEAVSRWNDIYTTSQITQGFLIALTDGSDTQGSHTLQQALNARGSKKVYTIGLGSEIEPDVLASLGNSGFYSITDIQDLSSKFIEIQNDITVFSNSFYWLNYMSPKRGDFNHTIELSIIDNLNSGSNSKFSGTFNSKDFFSVYQGLYINATADNPYGIDEITIMKGDTARIAATTYLGNLPSVYKWSSQNSSIINIFEDEEDNAGAFMVAVGDSGETADVLVQDEANNLWKALRVNIASYVTFFESFESAKISESWKNTGDAQWSINSQEKYHGDYSIVSGSITNDGTSSISRTYDVPYNTKLKISFACKVSSENDFDFLRFYINGVEIDKWSGAKSWNTYDYDYTANSSELELTWKYTKDASGSSGQDKAWLDYIKIEW